MPAIKGLHIELGLDLNKVTSGFSKLKASASATGQVLKEVNRGLKFDPTNITLLTAKQKTLTQQIETTKEKLTNLTQQQQKLNEETDKTGDWQTKMDKVEAEIMQNINALNAFENALKKTNAELKYVGSQAEQWDKIGSSIQRAGDKMSSIGGKLSNVGRDITNVGNTLLPVSLAAGGALVGLAKTGIEFQDAFAGVRKTVDATEGELKDLEKGFIDLSTKIPITAVELGNIGEAAGQLGIETPNILEFTRVMADLGVATNLSSTEASSSLARLANITKMPQTEFSNLGSAVVALGNNFATTESEIIDMALGLAGAGNQIGLSEADILGIATALSSVGIQSEAGASSFSKAFSKIERAVISGGADLEAFAEISGMSAEAFATAFTTEPRTAIIEFIKGLGDIKGEGGSLTSVLDDLDMSEIRLSKSMKSLAGNSTLVEDAVTLSNKAWKENTALTREAEIKYGTVSNQIKIAMNTVKKALIEAFIKLTPEINDALAKITEAVTKFSDYLGTLSAEQLMMIVKALMGVAILAPSIIIVGKVIGGLGSIIKVTGKATETFGKAIKAMPKAWTAITKTASQLTGVFTNIGKAVGGSESAMSSLMAPLSTAGATIGLVVASLALVAGALVYLWKTNDEFKQKMTKAWEDLKNSFTGIFDPIIQMFKDFGFDITDIGDLLLKAWDVWAVGVGAMVLGIMKQLEGLFKVLGGITTFITGVLTMDWQQAWDGIKKIFDGFVTYLDGSAKTMFDPILSVFGTSTEEIKTSVGTWTTDTARDIVNWASNTKGSISTWVSDTIGQVDDWSGGAISGISTWASTTKGIFMTWGAETGGRISTWFSETTLGFTSWVSDTWSRVSTWFSDTSSGFTSWATDTQGRLSGWWTTSTSGFTEWTTQLGGLLGDWFSGQDVDWQAWSDDTMLKLTSWIDTSKAGLGTWATDTFAGLGIWQANTVAGFGVWVTDTGKKLSDWASSTVAGIQQWSYNTGATISSWYSTTAGMFVAWKDNVGNTIQTWATGIWDKITGTLNNIITAIVTWASNAKNAFVGFKDSVLNIDWLYLGGRLMQLIQLGVNSAIGAIGDSLRSAAQSGWDAVTGFDWYSVGANIVRGIISGITSFGSSIASTLGGFVSNAISNAKSLLNINSPSKVFRDMFMSVGEGAVLGLNKSMPEMVNTLSDYTQSAVDDSSNMMKSVLSSARTMTSVLPSAVSSLMASKGSINLKGMVNASSQKESVTTVGDTNVTINITAPKGMNEDELAKKIQELLVKNTFKMRGART